MGADEYEVTLPALGESITDATLMRWLVEEGAPVTADGPIVEVATDEVDSEVTAARSGILQVVLAHRERPSESGRRSRGSCRPSWRATHRYRRTTPARSLRHLPRQGFLG